MKSEFRIFFNQSKIINSLQYKDIDCQNNQIPPKPKKEEQTK